MLSRISFEQKVLALNIALAKQKGKCLGRKPTAIAKGNDVKFLVAGGVSKRLIADQLGKSLSSV